jgi:hypothetical protein
MLSIGAYHLCKTLDVVCLFLCPRTVLMLRMSVSFISYSGYAEMITFQFMRLHK